MPLNVRTDRAISASLQAGGVGLKAQFYEYLDLHRHPSAKHRQVLAELLRERYEGYKIDAIITLYPEALQFCWTRANHFSGPHCGMYSTGLRCQNGPPNHTSSGDMTGTLKAP
jgi:hypothetical protein